MSANSVNSGVRNLRAMFENKVSDQSTSPPSRGRSPNPSEISNNSRPVSKVRASFVAIERPGENGGAPILGLRRASEVGSMEGIQENAVIEDAPAEKPVTAGEASKPSQPTISDLKPSADGIADEGGLGTILKGSAFIENTPSKPPSEARNLDRAIKMGAIPAKIGTSSPAKPKDESKAAAMVEKVQAKEGSKPAPPPATTLNAPENAKRVKLPPTRQVNTKAMPNSPVVAAPPRTPASPKVHVKGGPAKIKGVMESAKKAQQAREAMKRETTNAEKAEPLAPSMDNRAKSKAPTAVKKEQTPASPQSVRSPTNVKPRAPTLPGKLPAAVTATTASAAAKQDGQHSPTEPERKPVAKKTASLSARAPRASTSSTTSTLARKASRTSLISEHDRPKSRVSTTKPDEGFLARMMRPTASSAQKAHEKVPNSPPKTKKPTMPTKGKHATMQDAPPKMHVEEPTDYDADAKQTEGGQQNQDQSVLPGVTHPSPLAVVKEDAMDTEAEKEPGAPEMAHPVDKVNGEAPEVY